MNKLQEFLELNEMSEIYATNRTKSRMPFPEEDISDIDLLICSFSWRETEEGFDFWQSVNNDYLTWLYAQQG